MNCENIPLFKKTIMKILNEAECIWTKKYGNQKYASYLYYLKIIYNNNEKYE